MDDNEFVTNFIYNCFLVKYLTFLLTMILSKLNSIENKLFLFIR
jgi:hypothetical protein